MKPHQNSKDVAVTKTSESPALVDVSADVGSRAAANQDLSRPQAQHRVNPLWMITAALAFMFALLAVVASFAAVA
jgi:hypothetical protein